MTPYLLGLWIITVTCVCYFRGSFQRRMRSVSRSVPRWIGLSKVYYWWDDVGLWCLFILQLEVGVVVSTSPLTPVDRCERSDFFPWGWGAVLIVSDPPLYPRNKDWPPLLLAGRECPIRGYWSPLTLSGDGPCHQILLPITFQSRKCWGVSVAPGEGRVTFTTGTALGLKGGDGHHCSSGREVDSCLRITFGTRRLGWTTLLHQGEEGDLNTVSLDGFVF